MISLTDEDRKKIELIDKLFSALNKDDLDKIVEAEHIVAKLKGAPTGHISIIGTLVNDLNSTQVDLLSARNDINLLKADIGSILRAMTQPFPNNQNFEFQSLKQRYGI